MKSRRFRLLVFWSVIYTLMVIVWGAWVRISHSGDGCGDSWPLCQGQVIPDAEHHKTWIEYAHRAMSGIFGLLVFYIFWQSKKIFERGHRARAFGRWLLIFCIIEALLGAVLVKAGFVGGNASFTRALMIGVHQINSLLLSGVAALLYLTSSEVEARPPLKYPSIAYWKYMAFMLIAMTGAWAALSSSLFPSLDLAETFRKEFSGEAPMMMRLRSLHPLLALTVGVYVASWLYKKAGKAPGFLGQAYLQTSVVWCFALGFGILTLLLLSPVWMKLSHLLIAHLVWMALLRLYYIRDQFN